MAPGDCRTRRNDPDLHAVIAVFDDYDSAMINENLPETKTHGEKRSAPLNAPPTFNNLDVVHECGR